MDRIIIQGGGLVGRAMAFDMCNAYHVTVIDNNTARLDKLSRLMPSLHTIEADLSDPKKIGSLISDADLVINALPSSIGFQTLLAVIEAGKSIVSVSTLTESTNELNALAIKNGVTAVIDAGIAPGLSNLIVGHHIQSSDIYEYECLFGGLPRVPEWPLYHKDYYPPQELFTEYVHPAEIVHKGQKHFVSPLNDIERIEFPDLGTLEAIQYNGLATLAETMHKRIPTMKTKMLRFPQHFAYIQALLKCNLLSSETVELANSIRIRPIDLTAKVLETSLLLNEDDSDTIVMRITLRGNNGSYKYHMLTHYDNDVQLSAMSRATAYTCTAISRLILSKTFVKSGIIPPEIIGMELSCFTRIMDDLHKRGLALTVEHTENND